MLTQHYHKVNRGVIVEGKKGFVSPGGELQIFQRGMHSEAAKRRNKKENICILSHILYDRNSQDIWKTSYLAYLSVKHNYASLEGVFFFMIWTSTLHDKQNSNTDDDD